jgi:hypothetical protein
MAKQKPKKPWDDEEQFRRLTALEQLDALEDLLDEIEEEISEKEKQAGSAMQ